ncbi:hypothetical protein BGZ96_000708 [Linnemannia gamsii]|uniref:Zf-CHY-domain-containing protein n=1 Tax=Linnemannia gamsii TaxID=64522 RepID=A0ABQ7KAM1_9FUNG|nr:hypothetical protein BGZ96_000708 [Linnemannia gamsii]
MSSRTPSIYSDALETPLEDPHNQEDDLSRAQISILQQRQQQLRQHPTAVAPLDPNADSAEQDVEVDDPPAEQSGNDDDAGQDTEPMEEDGGAQVESAQRHQHFTTVARGGGGGGDDMDVDEDHQQQGGSSSIQVDSVAQNRGVAQAGSAIASAQHDQRVGSGTTAPTSADTPEAGGTSPSSSSSGAGVVPGRTGTASGAKASAPAVDEKAQSELRRKIMEIQRDPNINFVDKAGMIQARLYFPYIMKLMSSRWQNAKRSVDSHNDGSVEATKEDLKKTFYNMEQNQLGCKHYRRGCKLKANCCGRWFNCRFCHDDATDHTIVRSETKMMLCMHCQTIQEAAQDCTSCKARMAVYYCDTCKLWDDDPKKHIYHCDDCGICRIGQGLGRDYFHCKKCNVCMNIQLQDNHKCIERNLECDCPICGEYMFTSTSTVIFMPCGHCIHSRCHEDYIKTSYQCPTCWKSLGDMSVYYSKIDSLLAEQTMPAEYANIFSIVLCNDCEVKSEAPYHFLYHRCDKCRGYNTKVLETFKRVGADGHVQVVDNAIAAGAAGTAPENNITGGNTVLGGTAGSSSTSSSAGVGPSSGANLLVPGGTVVNMSVSRSPLMDENASGDMTMAGISGNSAP